ncbi:Subtilisin-like protease SBT5.4 [Capsicum baccatum]|uniref:Subtilisin-like protease SBT5.4 n=1 Tax=Capsicum baccatum TaxID=33114 RepID=A0A2G2VFZ5_CAPBA|nr:Subtilisin-like protease SBT5.4 [Capsicum baccatum]
MLNITLAPSMGVFSPVGPNTLTPRILKPDITAPGVDIIAAYNEAVNPIGEDYNKCRSLFNMFSGTSMACPHVAGVVGLLKSLHPDWSPAAIMATGKSRDFGIDGIMYDATTKYNGLVEAIATQLMIDTSANTLEIRYIISDRCLSMVIHNDTNVQVYLEQKKIVFLKYPLYVTILDKTDDVIHQTEGAIVCVRQKYSNKKNEQRRKPFSKDCARLIGISPDFEEFEEERVDVICDVMNINIAVKQTYKDKQTLANVMELHAFMKQFSYRTERSSGSRPIVIVDGAALKLLYGGTMLTASTLDPGVEPFPCESTWEIPREVLDEVVLPPDSKRPPGRPCYERWKAPNKDKCKCSKVTCSDYHREGHNKRTFHKHAPSA